MSPGCGLSVGGVLVGVKADQEEVGFGEIVSEAQQRLAGGPAVGHGDGPFMTR
jgi:hypothetical protein